MQLNRNCNLCSSQDTSLLECINKKPLGESTYLAADTPYYREIRHCNNCDVYFNFHRYNIFDESFYQGDYNAAIKLGNLEQRFERIIALREEESDNIGRVKRIDSFFKGYFKHDSIRILDVGSGTGVFPYEILKLYKDVSAVDPDQSSCSWMIKRLALKNVWNGSLQSIPPVEKFDFISFNKVLEHIQNPLDILNTAKSMMRNNAALYIELPYAEDLIATNEQRNRAEFFIEHYNTYTKHSLRFLIEKAGLTERKLGTIVEPSGKHTIYTFTTHDLKQC